jgi:hypothetical protein
MAEGLRMTEVEWLSTAPPALMLEFLRGKESPRKLRLFACALVRSVPFHRDGRTIWDLVPGFEWFRGPIPGGRTMTCHELIEAAERQADGEASAGERETVRAFARGVQERAEADTFENDPALGPGVHYRGSSFRLAAAEALAHATEDDPDRLCAFMLNYQVLTPTWDRRSKKLIHPDLDTPIRHLIRDVFGNPFRRVDVALGWLSPGVVSLARRLYDDRAFDRMPLLAEALEGAGCDQADILLHCRSPLAHVRGCWVLDALLGKTPEA